jgi:hypothetical protein
MDRAARARDAIGRGTLIMLMLVLMVVNGHSGGALVTVGRESGTNGTAATEPLEPPSDRVRLR